MAASQIQVATSCEKYPLFAAMKESQENALGISRSKQVICKFCSKYSL
jgi:hypothetical protein